MAITPFLPIDLSLVSSTLFPIRGFGSTFQSPVCKITPSGVVILNPLGSKIECVNVTKSISKGPNFIWLFSSTIFK